MRHGINIIARLNDESGTSIAARAVVEVLKRAGIPMAYLQLPNQPGARNGTQSILKPTISHLDHFPYDTLLVLDLPFLVDDLYSHIANDLKRFTVGTVLYWELEHLPLNWQKTYRAIDVPFAPSSIVKTALSNCGVANVPTIPIVPIDLPQRNTRRAGERPFRFFMNFDILSSISRKNAQAPINAFIQAFGQRRDVELIIKIWEFDHTTLNREPLMDLERRYPSIKHVFGHFSYEQTRALIADSDAYISLHRSEGLGLGMLEAMAAGVPVIATDYGGNTDYLDESCGFPISYTAVSSEGSDLIYNRAHIGRAATWADPDISYAAAAMQRIVADTAGYAALSQGARRRYEERQAAFESLAWLAPLYRMPERMRVLTGEVEASCNILR